MHPGAPLDWRGTQGLATIPMNLDQSEATTTKRFGSDLLLNRFPDSLRPALRAAGVEERDCLFSLRSDLALDGSGAEVWLVLTHSAVLSAATGQSGETPVCGPHLLSRVKKVRTFHTVGSAVLQLMIDGLYVDVVRYSNARREMFERARVQIQRLIKGEGLDLAALTRPSERVCAECGLPLPSAGATCPRCSLRRGLLWRTVGLMAPYRGYVILLLCLMLVGVGVDLIPPLLTRTLVDKVLVPSGAGAVGHPEWLPYILLILVAAALAQAGLNINTGRTSSLIGTRITRELRQRLQRRLIRMSVDYYDRQSVGGLMSRVLYDVDYFQGFVVQVAQGFLLNLMRVLGIGVVLFLMNWRLAFLVLLPIPFVVVGTTFFWRHIYPRYYKLWDSQSKMAQLLSGLLSGARLVKSFGQERREQRRFAESAKYMRDARRSVEMSVATFSPIMGFMFGLGGLIIWYAGGRQVLGERMTLGTLMAFFGYVGMFYTPITALSMFSNWLTGFMSAGQRVFEVLDATPSVAEARHPVRLRHAKGKIELRHVTFGYDPYTPVLKDVTLTIAPGQFVGIVGKSGSGKTTLVNLICRFYDVQQGEVLLDGVDVRNLALGDLHRQVGLVLQEPFLFRASIAENIAYGRPDSSPTEIMDAAKAANAHEFTARLPAGYDMQLGERGAGLSGGERQRVSIARALLCDPRILILDEATSSVDTESEQAIQRALAVLCRGRTTMAIAHRLSTLKNADHIFVIDEGRLAESGTHDELMALGKIYYKLVKIQTELARVDMD